MNLRSTLLRAALVVALLGFAFVVALLVPRPNPDNRLTTNQPTPLLFFPLVALPLVHALLSP